MNTYEELMYNEFYYVCGQRKFSLLATKLTTTYIRFLYAASNHPINLPFALSLLYPNMKEAKEGHSLNRSQFDVILQLFQHDWDYFCEKEFKTKKRSRDATVLTLTKKALTQIAMNCPRIIEPIYAETKS